MSRETTEFVIYIINEIAVARGQYPSVVYKTLEKAECIKDYLVPYYDVLHTMSSQNIVKDVLNYMKMKNVTL